MGSSKLTTYRRPPFSIARHTIRRPSHYPEPTNKIAPTRPQFWHSPELTRKDKATSDQAFYNFSLGTIKEKKTPQPSLKEKPASPLQNRLIAKLKKQPYFQQLKWKHTPQSDQAQEELINWFGRLIQEESQLEDQITLKATKSGKVTASISPYEWFDLLIQDQIKDPKQKELIKNLKELDSSGSAYAKGHFYENRFKIGFEVLKGLGLIKANSEITERESWLDRIGIDALIGFSNPKLKGKIPIQIKSSILGVKDFFKKKIPHDPNDEEFAPLRIIYKTATEIAKQNQTKAKRTPPNQVKPPYVFQRKNILTLDLSSFSISSLIECLKNIQSLGKKHIAHYNPANQGKGAASLEVKGKTINAAKNQTTIFLPANYDELTLDEQKKIIAQKYILVSPPSKRKRFKHH